MNKKDFEKFFNELKVFEPCAKPSKYDSYFDTYNTYFEEYQKYLKGAKKKIKKKIESNKKLIVFFLESGPKDIENYIFWSLIDPINPTNDSFLWNICTGFGLDPRGKTKRDCLKLLYSREIPVLIIDLFPFHGINLSEPKGNPYRRQILEEFKRKKPLFVQALKDPIDILSRFEENEKIFLFGVPGSFWNSFGGAGKGSVCLTNLQKKSGPLGQYSNKTNVVNVGGQTISSAALMLWCEIEGV
jgi:hypothetical protein